LWSLPAAAANLLCPPEKPQSEKSSWEYRYDGPLLRVSISRSIENGKLTSSYITCTSISGNASSMQKSCRFIPDTGKIGVPGSVKNTKF